MRFNLDLDTPDTLVLTVHGVAQHQQAKPQQPKPREIAPGKPEAPQLHAPQPAQLVHTPQQESAPEGRRGPGDSLFPADEPAPEEPEPARRRRGQYRWSDARVSPGKIREILQEAGEAMSPYRISRALGFQNVSRQINQLLQRMVEDGDLDAAEGDRTNEFKLSDLDAMGDKT